MTRTTLTMNQTLYQYYLQNSLREPPILEQLRLETAKLSAAKMQIAPEQGQFLSFLIKLIGAKKTIDIGVFTGYSSLVVALALPDEGRVIACDTNIEWTKIAKKYWQLAEQDKKIALHLAPAQQTLDHLLQQGEANTFDFIFIDADKQNYDVYYEYSLKLVRPGGIIAIDNVLWGGLVADEANQEESTVAIRLLNQKIHQDDRVILSMLPLADGLTLVIKRG